MPCADEPMRLFGVSDLNPHAGMMRVFRSIYGSTETDSAIISVPKMTQITTSNYRNKFGAAPQTP